MYCPICGQRQATENIRFCSRCGFLLSGIADVVANQGIIPNQSVEPETPVKDSRKKRGVKQGVMIFLIGLFLVVPILLAIHAALGAEPYLALIAAIISFFGGIIRIIYALMFEEGAPKQVWQGNTQQFVNQQYLVGNQGQRTLPSSQANPAHDYIAPKAGSWMATNDLVQPGSVTEQTTKFLLREEER